MTFVEYVMWRYILRAGQIFEMLLYLTTVSEAAGYGISINKIINEQFISQNLNYETMNV